MFFSIIIPIYNVENYLEECVNSALKQTFFDFEIILVNDGSNDKSGEICNKFAIQDKRVRVFHKNNGGASDARNLGINKSIGNYCLFLDSDDYWDDDNALSKIYRHLIFLDKIEILLFYWKKINLKTNNLIKNKKKYNVDYIRKSNKENILNNLHKNGLFPSSAVITVTKRTFIIKNNLFFVKGIEAEDIDWALSVLKKATYIDAINENFYVVQAYREGSVTSTPDIKSIESIIFILDKWIPSLLKDNSLISKIYLDHLAFHYSTTFITYGSIPTIDRKRVVNKLKKYFFLLDHIKSKRTYLVKIIIKIFGINLGSSIISKLYKFKIQVT